MPQPDDCSLDPAALRAVEKRARALLERADAWGRFPTPVEDVLVAAKLRVAPASMFDPVRLVAYLRDKAADAVRAVKSALSKVLGVYDAGEQVIHIDDTVVGSRQTFLTLHETGHHEMPTHRQVFTLFQDCEKTLDPDVADQFEREANNFARFALFQGEAYMKRAADLPCSLKSTRDLAKAFGASLYASAREFVRTHHRACAVYVLEPWDEAAWPPLPAVVRRAVASPKFLATYGAPSISTIGSNHPLWAVLPRGRQRVVRPTTVSLRDGAGIHRECVVEAFNTTHNILILVMPVESLTRSNGIARPHMT